MDYDEDKVDDAVLALLFLTMSRDKYGARAWKGHDWDALNRHHAKSYIGDPKSKVISLMITEEGEARVEELFHKLFGKTQ